MACGPVTLTPQILSTAMTFFGQPAALPQDLSLVMNPGRTQPEMKIDVQCDGTGKATGFTLERYFDTMTTTTTVVPLDDGEVDERSVSIQSANDGRVAQKLTVLLDTENKIAQYRMEALCSGTNPSMNYPVCQTHVPTVNGFALPNQKGSHADWMQAFVPEVISGAEYLFVPTAEYETEKKKIEDKRKASVTPPTPSATATTTVTAPPVPTVPAPAQGATPAPSGSTQPAVSKPKAKSHGGPSWGELIAAAFAALGLGGFAASRFIGKKSEADSEKKSDKVRRNAHPDAKKAVEEQVEAREDPGIQKQAAPLPPPSKKGKTPPPLPKPTAPTKTVLGGDLEDELENEIKNLGTGERSKEKLPADAGDDEMEEVRKYLEDVKTNMSPTGEKTPSAPPASPPPPAAQGGSSLKGITPESVIIDGDKAAPVNGLDLEIVMAQVAFHYRQFLSPGIAKALQKGNPLPKDVPLLAEDSVAEVKEIAYAIISDYHAKAKTRDGKDTIADLWKSQLAMRGYIVRRGAPMGMILQHGNKHFEDSSESGNSPYSGGVGARIVQDAERDAGENSFIKGGLREYVKNLLG